MRQVLLVRPALREAALFGAEVREHDVAARYDDGVPVVVRVALARAVADVGADALGARGAAAGIDGSAGDLDQTVGIVVGLGAAADAGGSPAAVLGSVGVDPAARDADAAAVSGESGADAGGVSFARFAGARLDDASGDDDVAGPVALAAVGADARAVSAAARVEPRVGRGVRDRQGGAMRNEEPGVGGIR